MPRELLPLPKLQLEKRQLQKVDASKDKNLSSNQRKSESGDFQNDQDFVRLPNNRTDGSIENRGILFSWVEKAHDTAGTIYDLLGVTLKQDPKTAVSYIDLQPGVATQVFAAYQWTLHAGRHDLAAGLVDAYKEINCADDYSNLLEIQQKTLLRDNKRNIFTRLFDTQLNLAIAYTVSEYESQNEGFSKRKEIIKKITAQCFSRDPSPTSSEMTAHSISDRINAEWKQTKQESPDGHEFLTHLVEKCDRALGIRLDIQYHSSLDDVIALILPMAGSAQGAPASNYRQADFIETWPLLTVIPVFAQTIFGALACAARNFDETSNGCSELRSLVNKIDTMLGTFRRRFHDIYQTDFLLAPLYAANIALAATIRQYDKAHGWLEQLLRDTSVISSKVSLYFSGSTMPYSDILWSQMIQLRGTLPKRLQASSLTINSNEFLPTEHIEDSQKIESTLEKLGVYPCHVVLRNDSAIVRIMNQLKTTSDFDNESKRSMKSSFFSLQDYLQSSFSSNPNRLELINLSFKGHHLPALKCYEPTSSLEYAIPQSILLCGHVLESLNLCETGLRHLHSTFGTYFPNLRTLDLSANSLASLPQSIGRLDLLQNLIVDRNRLSRLPDFRLKQLKNLSASENLLDSIPETIRDCTALRTVDFSGNTLNPQFYVTMSKLPNLISYKPEKIAKKSSLKRKRGRQESSIGGRKTVRFML